MGYIGKELQFSMIQFLRFHLFYFAQPELILQQNTVTSDSKEPENRSGSKQCVQDIRPPGCPERGKYHN